MQAGDQVAFELVGDRRLVAQVIKSADGPLAAHATQRRPKAASQRKRKPESAVMPDMPHKAQREMYPREAEVAPLA